MSENVCVAVFSRKVCCFVHYCVTDVFVAEEEMMRIIFFQNIKLAPK